MPEKDLLRDLMESVVEEMFAKTPRLDFDRLTIYTKLNEQDKSITFDVAGIKPDPNVNPFDLASLENAKVEKTKYPTAIGNITVDEAVVLRDRLDEMITLANAL